MLLTLLQAAQTAPNWNEDVITRATIVIAAATVLALVANVLLWLTTRQSTNLTRDMFEASHRPYVHVANVTKTINGRAGAGVGVDLKAIKFVSFDVELRNVGSVPARDFVHTLRIVVDGIMLPNTEHEERTIGIVFPSATAFTFIEADDPREISQIINAKKLSLIVGFTYKGVGDKTYSYEQKSTYNEKIGGFGTNRETAT